MLPASLHEAREGGMGLFDKLKDVANMVTGGAARVSIEYEPQVAFPGENVSVRITATSTGPQVKSGGVFADLRAVERVNLPRGTAAGVEQAVQTSHTSFEQAVQLAPAFTLAPNETKTFEGTVRLPSNAQPTFAGHYTQHEWSIRGRVEMTGNDPDSGFQVFRVGTSG
jgi:sporulation-control protein spo0M